MTEQFWTTNEVAAYLGLANGKSAAAQLSRWGIQPVARQPGKGGMNLYDSQAIRDAHAARPGRGNHTPKAPRIQDGQS